jgi:hypothetical protein
MTTFTALNLRARFTAGALGVMFAGASLAAATPAHADTALVQDRLARSIQATTSGLTTEISERRYVGTQQLPVPGIATTRFIFRGNASANLKASEGYTYEYVYRKQFTDKKASASVRQGIAGSTRDGGSWIQRSNIARQIILPRAIAQLNPDVIVTNVQGQRALRDQVSTVDGMTPQEKARTIVDLPRTYGSVQAGSVGFNGDVSMTWRTGPYTTAMGDSCSDSFVGASFINGLLVGWRVEGTNCTTSDGQSVRIFTDGRVLAYDGTPEAAPEPRVNFEQ